MHRIALLSLLLAGSAFADAPHGKYALDAKATQPVELPTGHRLESCGERTAGLRARLHHFDVSFRSSRTIQGSHEVLVDNEPWKFDGYCEDPDHWPCASTKKSGSTRLQLYFGRDREGNAAGNLVIIGWDGSKAVCGDALWLRGMYVWHP